MAITDTLPGIQLDWDQYSESGWTWVQYNVYRRLAAYTDIWGASIAAGAWERIAVIDDAVTTISYTYYHVKSGVDYDFAVTVTANNGSDTLESDKQDPAPTDSVTFSGIAVHEISDTSRFCVMHGQVTSPRPRQQQGSDRARGRRASTAFIGEGFERTVEIQERPHRTLTDRDTWEALYIMLDEQYDPGVMLCVRPSHSQELFFCTINGDGLSRVDDTAVHRISLRLTERFYDESV